MFRSVVWFMVVMALNGRVLAEESESPQATEVATTGVVEGRPLARTIGPDQYQALTGRERWALYKWQLINPGSFFRAAGPALGRHLGNEPSEWGQGWDAYARRAAAQYGEFAIQDSVSHAGAAIVGHDPRYVRCPCDGFVKRFGWAMAGDLIARRNDGKLTFAYTRIGGYYAGDMVATALWMPGRYDPIDEGLRGGTRRIALGGVFNLVREFWPELRRTFSRR